MGRFQFQCADLSIKGSIDHNLPVGGGFSDFLHTGALHRLRARYSSMFAGLFCGSAFSTAEDFNGLFRGVRGLALALLVYSSNKQPKRLARPELAN